MLNTQTVIEATLTIGGQAVTANQIWEIGECGVAHIIRCFLQIPSINKFVPAITIAYADSCTTTDTEIPGRESPPFGCIQAPQVICALLNENLLPKNIADHQNLCERCRAGCSFNK